MNKRGTINILLSIIYPDIIDERIILAAKNNLKVHLQKLIDEEIVT